MNKETLNKWIPLMVRCFVRLSITTNGINNLPFVLSLSKDLFSVSLVHSPDFPSVSVGCAVKNR